MCSRSQIFRESTKIFAPAGTQVGLLAAKLTNRSKFASQSGASKVESLKPLMDADAGGCASVRSALIGVHRRLPSRFRIYKRCAKKEKSRGSDRNHEAEAGAESRPARAATRRRAFRSTCQSWKCGEMPAGMSFPRRRPVAAGRQRAAR